MAGLMIYGLLQKRLPGVRGIVNFRAGGGLYSVFNFYKEASGSKDDSVNALFPVISAGVSFQWFFYRSFYVDAGIEYSHLFSFDGSSPGYFRPVLGAGIQL
jgi:hypothetical protein